MSYILFGSPGSGKGTVCEFFSAQGYTVIAMGRILRRHVREKTAIGRRVECCVQNGNLIPDQLAIDIIDGEIKANTSANQPFIIEGFPSTPDQYRLFQPVMRKLNVKILSLECSEKIALNRIRDRIICQNCEDIYNLQTKPPRVTKFCDKCQSPLSERNEDDPLIAKRRICQFYERIQPILSKVAVHHVFNASVSYEDLLASVNQWLDADKPFEKT